MAYAHRFLGSLRHAMQLMPIMAILGDIVRDDQVMLGIYSGLYVVADHPATAATRCHGSGIGVGE
jgi:hypothetical protein